MNDEHCIPFIDVFAGPGGLGEGFAALERGGTRPFRCASSIEKDEHAHRTLELRSFYRQFPPEDVPPDYYRCLRREITRDELYAAHPEAADAARAEAWCAELGVAPHREVRERVGRALGNADPWVLLGGPPCQPFSLAGRSRNRRGTRYSDGKETRHDLYIEYLRIIADFWPAVFVMENVRGLLSARFDGRRMFDRIYEDLQDPIAALAHELCDDVHGGQRHQAHRYKLHAVTHLPLTGLCNGPDHVEDFVVRMEHHGVPQARHRLILVGVRSDLGEVKPDRLQATAPIPVRRVLADLPPLRSGLSQRQDRPESWLDELARTSECRWFKASRNRAGAAVHERLKMTVAQLRCPAVDRGREFIPCVPHLDYAPEWFLDPRLSGVCNHVTRGHMVKDLHRYLYAACFAAETGRSPSLRNFPRDLLPRHANVHRALNGSLFADRFRVQVADRPSTTVVSHIAKDGHYYIHPDPAQCRSLTVREAARLQTFPDNYLFVGNRTQQYTQVGNAVPPLLARQIASVVYDLLHRSGAKIAHGPH